MVGYYDRHIVGHKVLYSYRSIREAKDVSCFHVFFMECCGDGGGGIVVVDSINHYFSERCRAVKF